MCMQSLWRSTMLPNLSLINNCCLSKMESLKPGHLIFSGENCKIQASLILCRNSHKWWFFYPSYQVTSALISNGYSCLQILPTYSHKSQSYRDLCRCVRASLCVYVSQFRHKLAQLAWRRVFTPHHGISHGDTNVQQALLPLSLSPLPSLWPTYRPLATSNRLSMTVTTCAEISTLFLSTGSPATNLRLLFIIRTVRWALPSQIPHIKLSPKYDNSDSTTVVISTTSPPSL